MKTELFEHAGLTIITWFPCPSFPRHKTKMTGDCCVFNFLRRSVDGKHLKHFQSQTPFSDFPGLVWTSPKFHDIKLIKTSLCYGRKKVGLLERGALGYSRNRKTEGKFIQNSQTANKIGQNRILHTKLYTQIGPNRKKIRKNQKPHWVPKPKNRWYFLRKPKARG